jgi:hypothetical protein
MRVEQGEEQAQEQGHEQSQEQIVDQGGDFSLLLIFQGTERSASISSQDDSRQDVQLKTSQRP